jgi:serine/threonine protein kinase
MIAAILTAEPVSNGEQQIEKTENLRQIFGKALNKSPAKRYQTANEMAEDLKKTRLDLNSFSETDFIHATDFREIGETDSRIAATSDTLIKRSTDIFEEKKSGKNKIIFAFAAVSLLVLLRRL